MGKHICQLYLRQGFNLQYTYTKLILFHIRSTNNPIKKWTKRPEKTLLQGGHTEGPETYERMLSITDIREMQIKTTMRYHLTLVRVANINKSINKYWRG